MNERQKENLQNKIREWIDAHREELIHDLKELISIPSVSVPQENSEEPYGHACRQALEYMTAKGESIGLKAVGKDAGCVQLLWEGRDGKEHPSLGIWAHLDVVPAGDGWHYSPFAATEHDGYLVGRGCGDDKGPAIGILYAVRCLKELGVQLSYPVMLGYGTSEENGMHALKAWLQSHKPPDYNLVADCGFPVCYAEMGSLQVRFRTPRKDSDGWLQAGDVVNMIPSLARWECGETSLEASGRSAHVAAPGMSVNALHELAVKVLESGKTGSVSNLWEFAERMTRDGYGRAAGIACRDDLSGPLVGQVTLARTTKDCFVLEADYRYPVFSGEKISDGEDLIPRLQETAEAYGMEMEVAANSLPAYCPKESTLVKELMRCYHELTDSDTEPFVMSGGTYAKILPNAVTYGGTIEHKKIYREDGWPDGVGDYHQSDESLRLEELLEAVYIWSATLADLELA